MQITSEALERVIEELARLPGTGRKSAQRIAIHLLKQSDERVINLADALIRLKKISDTLLHLRHHNRYRPLFDLF